MRLRTLKENLSFSSRRGMRAYIRQRKWWIYRKAGSTSEYWLCVLGSGTCKSVLSIGPFRDTLNLQIPTVGGLSVWWFEALVDTNFCSLLSPLQDTMWYLHRMLCPSSSRELYHPLDDTIPNAKWMLCKQVLYRIPEGKLTRTESGHAIIQMHYYCLCSNWGCHTHRSRTCQCTQKLTVIIMFRGF